MTLKRNQNIIADPLVSIIVITYNSAKYVLETLESAKAQTYKNIELIVSDDCSIDNTVDICRKWIRGNKKWFIRAELVTAQKNTGIPANCNRGVKTARGAWVKLIAGDDVLMENCITDNVNYVIQRGEIGIVFSKVNIYKNDFKVENIVSTYPGKYPTNFAGDKISSQDQFKMFLASYWIPAPTVFIKRHLIDKVGWFDERFPLVEDFPMWLKLTQNGYRFYFMDKVTAKYRRHDLSLSNSSGNSRCIINPVYFKGEGARRAYVYPFLSPLDKASARYFYFIKYIINKLGLNKKGKIFEFIYDVIFYYFNPFEYLLYFRNRLNNSHTNICLKRQGSQTNSN